MRIVSVQRGFAADHSSSTYEFFALERLRPEQKEAVRALTGEEPRGRKFQLHIEGEGEISSELEDALLTAGYDILISESYDWWNAQVSLPYDEALADRLAGYECEYDANGLQVRRAGERMIVYFGFQMDYSAAYGRMGEDVFAGLGDLFKQVRAELLAGDLSVPSLFAEVYECLEEIPESEEVGAPSETAKALRELIVKY